MLTNTSKKTSILSSKKALRCGILLALTSFQLGAIANDLGLQQPVADVTIMTAETQTVTPESKQPTSKVTIPGFEKSLILLDANDPVQEIAPVKSQGLTLEEEIALLDHDNEIATVMARSGNKQMLIKQTASAVAEVVLPQRAQMLLANMNKHAKQTPELSSPPIAVEVSKQPEPASTGPQLATTKYHAPLAVIDPVIVESKQVRVAAQPLANTVDTQQYNVAAQELPNTVAQKLSKTFAKRLSNKDLCYHQAIGGGRAKSCFDAFLDDQKGPELVVVPEDRTNEAKFAITKYEITKQQYRIYCLLSGECRAAAQGNDNQNATFDKKMAPISLELSDIEQSLEDYNRFCVVSGRCDGVYKDQQAQQQDNPHQVSFVEAEAYAKWLSKQTGHKYRLPTSDELIYALKAGTNDICSNLYYGGDVDSKHMMNSWGIVVRPEHLREWVEGNGRPAIKGPLYQEHGKAGCSIATNQVAGSSEQPSFRLIREVRG